MPIIGNFGGGSSKVDKTLLMEGVAADAKATGEAIEAAKTFVAIENETTFGEITQAFEAGKTVCVQYLAGMGIYGIGYLVRANTGDGIGYHEFHYVVNGQITILKCSESDSSWTRETFYLQDALSGTEGQIVGFDANGYATAQDFPQSDWSENDETALDYIKNKPVVSVSSDTLTWDGNTDGLVCDSSGIVYKVSESTPTNEELQNGEFVNSAGDGTVLSLSNSTVLAYSVFEEDYALIFESIVVARVAGITVGNMTLPEVGTYFLKTDAGYVHYLTLYGYSGFTTTKFDPSYLYQSDWNENDETAAGYVKNRPFWKDIGNSITLTGSGSRGAQLTCGEVIETIIFTEDKSASIDLDGTIYTNVVKKWTASDTVTIFYIGNATIISALIGLEAPEEDTGEIYCIAYNNTGDEPPAVYFSDTVKHNIIATVDVEEYTLYHKIPNEYLPTERFIISGTGKKSEIFNGGGRVGSVASGDYSHAEGNSTTASGDYSHAEGSATTASGGDSHAEGSGTTASGLSSHAEGSYTTASGEDSHAEGFGTIAASGCQHVQGKWNIEDADEIYLDIVGNGAKQNKRSNAHTLDWEGNAWFAGDVYVGSTSGTNKDEGSKKLITQEYVDVRVPAWTEADEGKVLKIVNGVPAWVNISVTSTDDGDGNVVIS